MPVNWKGMGAVGLRLCGIWALGSLAAVSGANFAALLCLMPGAPATATAPRRRPITSCIFGRERRVRLCLTAEQRRRLSWLRHPAVDWVRPRIRASAMRAPALQSTALLPPAPTCRDALAITLLLGGARGAGRCVTTAHAL
eukprot:361447-Chlamydomonas_euryale.AAC.4